MRIMMDTFYDDAQNKNRTEQLPGLPELFDKCLDKFCQMTSDYHHNLYLLTELAGELLHADYSLYKKVKGDSIINICVWNSPPDFAFAESPNSTISNDVIKNYPDELCLIRDLKHSKYAHSVSIVQRLGLETYLGYKVFFEDECRGVLCNMYKGDYLPTEAEKQIMKLIASYIGLEESRAQYAESYTTSQEMFRKIVETSNEGILRIDDSCKITYVNNKMTEILGCEVDDLIGHEIEEWLFPEDIDDHQGKVEDRVRGTQDVYERRFRKKDGSEVWTIISAAATFDENGRYTSSFGMCTDITERKLQEKELKESEERYRLLFSNAPVGIVLHSEKKVIDLNPAALRIFGAKHEKDLIGIPILDYVHPDHVGKAVSNIQRMINGEQGIYPYEYLFKKLDGSYFPVEVYANALTYQNKPSIQIIISDISDRKKTDAIKQRNEEGLKSIIKILQHRSESVRDFMHYTLDEAIRLTDSVYGFVFRFHADKQEFEMFACSRNAFEDSNMEQNPSVFKLSDSGAWGEVIRQRKPIIINDYQAYNPLKRGYPAGHIEILRFLSIPVIFDEKIVAILAVANKQSEYDDTDVLLLTLLMDAVWKIVDRKDKEIELRKLSRAVEQSPVSIVITNTEGRIEYVNEFLNSLTGWKADEVIGRKPSLFKSGETSQETYQALWKTISEGKTWKGEFHNRKKNGELYWEEATISPVIDDQARITHYIAVKEDITKRKQITSELIRAKESAEQMNRLKSVFLANMSHELRTPMVGILGFSELLPSLIDNPKAIEMANTIHNSGHRLLNTLNHILDLSRIEADKIEINWSKVNLFAVLKNAVRLFKASAARRKISLELASGTNSLCILSDSGLLEHVVNELIHNAIKYTEKGSVIVSLDFNPVDQNRAVMVRFKDTGIGIPQNKQELIFDAFRQGSEGYERSYEGSGLGLTISKKYIELLQGKITLNSEPGKGSEFCLCFPARLLIEDNEQKPIEGAARRDITADKTPLKMKLPQILLIDDDLVIKELCEHMLAGMAELKHVRSGEEVFDLLGQFNFDVILLDINLKGQMSGLEVLAKLDRSNAEAKIPIVAITAYSMLGDKERFLAGGCSHYLSKPFTKDELQAVIRQIIQ